MIAEIIAQREPDTFERRSGIHGYFYSSIIQYLNPYEFTHKESGEVCTAADILRDVEFDLVDEYYGKDGYFLSTLNEHFSKYTGSLKG
jgi:hypothetical protein